MPEDSNHSNERFPNKANLLVLISEVNTFRLRLNKGEVKPFADELKFLGVWLTNILQHVAELKLDFEEMAEVVANTPEGISPETATELMGTIQTLVEAAGGMDMLPAEVRLKVAGAVTVIQKLTEEEGEGEAEGGEAA